MDLDASHTQLQFRVRHMMLTNVTGDFKKFEVDVETQGDDFSTAKISATLDTGSVTTAMSKEIPILNQMIFSMQKNILK
jgi:polyisoprenoid-binding protein YceI